MSGVTQVHPNYIITLHKTRIPRDQFLCTTGLPSRFRQLESVWTEARCHCYYVSILILDT